MHHTFSHFQGRREKRKYDYHVRRNLDFDKAELMLYEPVEKMPPFSRKTLVFIREAIQWCRQIHDIFLNYRLSILGPRITSLFFFTFLAKKSDYLKIQTKNALLPGNLTTTLISKPNAAPQDCGSRASYTASSTSTRTCSAQPFHVGRPKIMAKLREV